MKNDLYQLSRSDGRYAPEAFEFVCEALAYTQERLGYGGEDAPPHVSGEELLRGGVELAIRDFGMMAPLTLQHWGLHSTDDFGELVTRLIDAGRFTRAEDDDPTAFQGAFDLMQALEDGYEFGVPVRTVDA